MVQDKLGSSSLLAERPGKRMAKHKSRAVSSSLAQRYRLSFGASHCAALIRVDPSMWGRTKMANLV